MSHLLCLKESWDLVRGELRLLETIEDYICWIFPELVKKGIAVPSHAEAVIGQALSLPSPPTDPPGRI